MQQGLTSARLARLAVALCLIASTPAVAQMMTVSGSQLSDSSNNLVADATLYAEPVTNGGIPLSYRKPAGGQATSVSVQATVTNGAFTITLPDVAHTVPQNVCFRITAIDNATGASLLAPIYNCVQPSSATSQNYWCITSTTCNFDLFSPSTPALTVSTPGIQGLPGIQGQPGPAGSIISAPNLYVRTLYPYGDSRWDSAGASVWGNSTVGILEDAHAGPTHPLTLGSSQPGDYPVYLINGVNNEPGYGMGGNLASPNNAAPIFIGGEAVNMNGCAAAASASACQPLYNGPMSAMVALSELGGTTAQVLPSAFTFSSGWTANTDFASPYSAMQSTTNGASFTFSITTTGNPIALEVEMQKAGAGTASCAVAGGATTAIPFGVATAVQPWLVQWSNFTVWRVELGAIAAGTHSVTCTVTSSTGAGNIVSVLGADSFPVGSTPAPLNILINTASIGGTDDAASALPSSWAYPLYGALVTEGANIRYVDVRTPMLHPSYYTGVGSLTCPTDPYGSSGGLHYNDCGHGVVARTIIAANTDIFFENVSVKGSHGVSSWPLKVTGFDYLTTMDYMNVNYENKNTGSGLFGGLHFFGHQWFDFGPNSSTQLFPGAGTGSNTLRINAPQGFCWTSLNAEITTGLAGAPPCNFFIAGGVPFFYYQQTSGSPTEVAPHIGYLNHDAQGSSVYGQISGLPDFSTPANYKEINYLGPYTSAPGTITLPYCRNGSSNPAVAKENPVFTFIRQGSDGYPITFAGQSETVNGASSYTWQASAYQVLVATCSAEVRGTGASIAASVWTFTPMDSTHNLSTLSVSQQLGVAGLAGIGYATNLVTNSASLTAANWVQQTNTAYQFTVVGGQTDPVGGTTALKLTTGATSGNNGIYADGSGSLTAGATYCYSMQAKGASGGEVIGFYVGNTTFPLTLTNAWQQFMQTVTAPSGAVFAVTATFPSTAASVYIAYPQIVPGACGSAPSLYVGTGASPVSTPTLGLYVGGQLVPIGGYTGTKTIGGCTLTYLNGSVMSITGC